MNWKTFLSRTKLSQTSADSAVNSIHECFLPEMRIHEKKTLREQVFAGKLNFLLFSEGSRLEADGFKTKYPRSAKFRAFSAS